MRALAWCLIGTLVACGQSKSRSGEASEGPPGDAATAGSGGRDDAEDGAGGDPSGAPPEGGRNPQGGAPAVAGSADGGGGVATGGAPSGGASNASGGGGGASGGQPPSTGGIVDSIGGAGAAGSSGEECGAYVACGCGCCNEDADYGTCYYPELGDTLEAIVAGDEEQSADPACAGAGCARGTRYVCCVAPTEVGEATYSVDASDADVDRLTILREDPEGGCTALQISSPIEGTVMSPISVPSGWGVYAGSDSFLCKNRFQFPNQRFMRGGVGFVRFASDDRCTIDFDYTQFFISEDGTVEATRSAAQGVPVPLGPGCE